MVVVASTGSGGGGIFPVSSGGGTFAEIGVDVGMALAFVIGVVVPTLGDGGVDGGVLGRTVCVPVDGIFKGGRVCEAWSRAFGRGGGGGPISGKM